jgi:hypothetical protein
MTELQHRQFVLTSARVAAVAVSCKTLRSPVRHSLLLHDVIEYCNMNPAANMLSEWCSPRHINA